MIRAWFARSAARWAVVAVAAVSAPVAASAETVSFVSTGVGPLLLVVPAEAAARPVPVVLALHDTTGPDSRARPYLDALNALGVATAEAVGGADDVDPMAAGGGVDAVVAALFADPRLDATRLGVLAFGAGGRAALAEPALAHAPAVLLYPGCAGLPPPPAIDRPVLVLHGGVDRADRPGACARWAALGGRSVRRHEYLHATYGWDFSDGPWSDGLALLPSPGGGGHRVWARSDPATTADAAERAAAFLAMAFDTAGVER